MVSVTPLVAILTLAASPALGDEPRPLPMDRIEALEHIPLPPVSGPLSVSVRAFQSTVVLSVPRAAGAVAAAVRKAPRALCAQLEERPGEVRLHCRTTRIVARLVRRGERRLLEIAETRGLPWGEAGPPVVPYDPVDAELGAPCPGSTPASRAECLLAANQIGGASTELAVARLGSNPDFAALRLGDLAFAAGDVQGAVNLWDRVHAPPWDRLASLRKCELSRSCLAENHPDALYAPAGLPATIARELLLRKARALALNGSPVAAARALLTEAPGPAACSGAPSLCQQLTLAALTAPGPAAPDALVLWLQLPDRGRGAEVYEAERGVANLAAQLGAPLYGANVLAAAAGRVPAHALEEHLLRTAELYAAGGDPVRAGVVVEFARQRAGKRGLSGARWDAVRRALAATDRKPAAHPPLPPAVPTADAGELLATVNRQIQAAHRLTQGDHP